MESNQKNKNIKMKKNPTTWQKQVKKDFKYMEKLRWNFEQN